MHRSFIAVLAFSCVLSSLALSQAPSQQSSEPSAAPASNASAANPSAVAANQPVISLPGVCDAKAGNPPPASSCVSSVSKEQFEKLVSTAARPDLSPQEKRNLAENYGKMLVFVDAARALNLENDPKVQQLIEFYKDQVLAQAVGQHYTQEYAHPSDQQVEEYYNQNKKKFREVTLQRVIVWMPPSLADGQKPTDAQQQEYVEQIREKWVGGGDPAKLQNDAMERAGMKTAAPDVNLGAKRPGTLPVAHEAVFELKPGEVSQPFSDPSASYIYKVLTVKDIPLSEVKDSIAKTLSQQMVKDKMESIANSVSPVLNDTYFGPPQAAKAPMMPPPGTSPRSMPPGAAPQSASPGQAPPK